jgi:hypothetical protein
VIARRFTFPLLLLLSACSVDATVGYNESAPGSSCAVDALSPCNDAGCGVTQVFDAPRGSTTLSVDETDIYFLTSAQSLGKRPIDGGEILELARADSVLVGLAGDATHVYWTELDGEVRGVSKAGGARFDASYVFGNPGDITLDSTHLYWVFPEFGQVAMAPKPTGEATHISGQDVPIAITTDRTHVYWVNAGTGAGAGQLVRAARAELTSAEVLLTGLDAPVAVGVSDAAVFWASKTAVFRLLKGETAARAVATGFSEVKGIGVTGDTVYGVGMEGLWRVPAAGGAWQVLERRPMSAMALGCSGVFANGWFENVLVRYGP